MELYYDGGFSRWVGFVVGVTRCVCGGGGNVTRGVETVLDLGIPGNVIRYLPYFPVGFHPGCY